MHESHPASQRRAQGRLKILRPATGKPFYGEKLEPADVGCYKFWGVAGCYGELEGPPGEPLMPTRCGGTVAPFRLSFLRNPVLVGAMKSSLIAGVAVLSVILLSTPSTAQGAKAGVGKSFKGPVGLQLYSLRDQFAKDVPGTLDKVASYGIKYAETAGTYGQAPAEFRAALQKRGITPVAGHFGFEQYRDDIAAVVRDAKALGLKYSGCAWIPHEEGIKFFYHIHGYEFQPYQGGTLMDLLMSETNPKQVAFEMDIFWVVHPGQDPVKLLERYGKRWELMHLKDMKEGTETGLLTGQSDVGNDVALGEGMIDLPPLLKAAKKAGVKWCFIEDESPVSERQIPQSLRYLERVSF
jgi:sugar phosphate isomerase/epimerase